MNKFEKNSAAKAEYLEKINEEFHEIEKCFQSCYFTYVNEQINIIEYYFRFLPTLD